MVTIKAQTYYDFGILRQDYEIIRGLPMTHTRVFDCVTPMIWVVPEQTETGGLKYRIGSDCAGHA